MMAVARPAGPAPTTIELSGGAKEEAALGRPLSPIEQARVKYDEARAPPFHLGAFNRAHYRAPAGVSWP